MGRRPSVGHLGHLLAFLTPVLAVRRLHRGSSGLYPKAPSVTFFLFPQRASAAPRRARLRSAGEIPFQRTAAAFTAMACRSSAVSRFARVSPPFRPQAERRSLVGALSSLMVGR